MTALCRLTDLDATGAKEITVDSAGVRSPAFVVRHDDGIAAYFNMCPHARLTLNSAPDIFLDSGRSVIVCANHGAHFDVSTGRCIRGPCKGESLRVLPIFLDGAFVTCAGPTAAVQA